MSKSGRRSQRHRQRSSSRNKSRPPPRRSLNTSTKCLVLILLLSLFTIALIRWKQTESRYARRYDTIAHQILDLEKDSDFEVTASHYEFLDDLIDAMVDAIAGRLMEQQPHRRESTIQELRKRYYTREDVLSLLQTVNEVLIQRNFAHKKSLLLKHTLTGAKLDKEVLRVVDAEYRRITSRDSIEKIDLVPHISNPERRQQVATFWRENSDKITHFREHPDDDYYYTDCYNTTAIYLSIADVLGLPLHSVSIPNHSFLRWHFSETEYLDWEETRGKVSDDNSYMRQAGLASEHPTIKLGIYLRSLRRTENLGVRHVLLGNLMLTMGRAPPNNVVMKHGYATTSGLLIIFLRLSRYTRAFSSCTIILGLHMSTLLTPSTIAGHTTQPTITPGRHSVPTGKSRKSIQRSGRGYDRRA